MLTTKAIYIGKTRLNIFEPELSGSVELTGKCGLLDYSTFLHPASLARQTIDIANYLRPNGERSREQSIN